MSEAGRRDNWGHLARRFLGALAPGGPTAGERAWVETMLEPGELALWTRQPGHDQRHSAGVARSVETVLAGGPHAGDTRWLACALLHDVGKLASGLGIPLRVLATLAGRATKSAAAARDTSGGPSSGTPSTGGGSGVRHRIDLYLRHPDLGAEMIGLAGGRPEVSHWAGAHHDPTRLDTSLVPAAVAAVLVAADSD